MCWPDTFDGATALAMLVTSRAHWRGGRTLCSYAQWFLTWSIVGFYGDAIQTRFNIYIYRRYIYIDISLLIYIWKRGFLPFVPNIICELTRLHCSLRTSLRHRLSSQTSRLVLWSWWDLWLLHLPVHRTHVVSFWAQSFPTSQGTSMVKSMHFSSPWATADVMSILDSSSFLTSRAKRILELNVL